MARSGTPHRWPAATVTAHALGASDVEAAAAGGCSVRSLARWKNAPAFQGEAEAVRRRTLERAGAQAVGLALEAVEALADVARTGPPAARVAAARAILDVGARYVPQAEAYTRDDDARAIAGANGCSLEEAYSALDRAEEMLREYRG